MNKAAIRSKNIFSAFSNLFIDNSLFEDANDGMITDLSLLYGAFINILDVALYISNSRFMRGTASYGGAIYISG